MSNPKHASQDARAAWRANALFRAMSSDYLLREQFATGPAEILADYVLAGRLPLEASETADQLLFSAFSNPALRRWMGGYARRATAVSRHAFAMDFARAAAASRDELVTLALIRGAAEAGGEFAVHADLLRWVIAAMGVGEVGSATEMSPGGGTEISPGGGTERSPGAVARPELINAALRNAERLSAEVLRADSAGTEMSPGGGGTEQSPGGGTEMSPGALSLAQRLAAEVRSAVRLSERILRGDADGTEVSPGGGTEISPGGGTDMSPGRVQRGMLLTGVLRSAERLGLDLLRVESGGTEVSPGGGTEISPGALRHTATLVAEIRLAARLNDELIRAEGATEMSPGGGTEQSPGGGTEMSPGASRQLERLSAGLVNAERLSVALLRAESGGTEVSPGGGTEVSPGGGTEMSPGASRLLERLVAEVRLASRLGSELVRAASGTEMSPGGGTEISPGGGTEMSPGGTRRAELLGLSLRNAQRLLAQFLRNVQNGTEVSPGGGTEVSPGGGTEVSPGAFGLAERLSTELRAAVRMGAQILRGFLDGTEMSPGTATEISPGTATEISPGALGDTGGWGIQLPGHVRAALDALVRYATALRARGALAVSGFEEG